MFAIECYIDDEFRGFLKRCSIYETTQDIDKAFLSSNFDEINKEAKDILDKTDFDDACFKYKIIQLELRKIKEYIPKSTSYLNDDFDIKTL